MECSRGRWRWSGRSMQKLVVLCFVVVMSLYCVCSLARSGSSCRGSTVLHSDLRRLTADSCTDQECSGGWRWRRRRRLSDEPGSYPPRCTSKCGNCSPCYPVHVAVPPGVPVTTEYYPEAWRCKCGNRLYMP